MQEVESSLWDAYKEKKWCKQCSRILPKEYPDDICPSCKEINLFAEVKEYIRDNDVREADVAEHFNLPMSKVRGWIREGRIQYRGINENPQSGKISSVFCQVCGKPINFGHICASCRRKQDMKGTAQFKLSDPSKMRFLDEEHGHGHNHDHEK